MQNVSKYLRQNLPETLLILLFFTALFVSFFHLITATTQDLGRHLLTGRIILTTGHVPATNLFSYTYPDFPFINTHWLSEVIFYTVILLAGLPGLLLSMTLAVVATFALLIMRAARYAGLTTIIAVATLLLRVLVERTDLRPELFSFLLLSVFLVILYKNRERFTPLIFLLPLLELLWVNLHIYFFIGIVVFTLFLLDLFLTKRRQLATRNNKLIIISFFLTCFAALINPHGITGTLYPLHVFQNYGYSIEENQTIFFLQTNFHKATIPFFELSVFLLFAALFLTLKRARLIDWLLAVCFTILGALAIRNFPLFVIAVFLPFSYSVSQLSQKIRSSLPADKRQLATVLTTIGISLALLLQIKDSVSKFPVTAAYEKGAENAVNYFQKGHLPGPIFNNFDIGSYLAYRLYPKEKVFVDGRPEAYPTSFFQDVYIPMQQDPSIFRKIQEKYGFQTILFSHTDQTPWGEEFISWITKDPSWHLVYLDDTMIILTKASGKKPLRDDPALLAPYSTSSLPLRKLAHFFSIAGWTESLKASLLSLLEIEPTNCAALGNLALLTQSQHDPSSVVYTTKYHSTCP